MSESTSLRKVYRFGVFQADARSGELFKHGIRIKLQDQPFQVLLALLEHPGEVVSRDELRQRIWADQAFGDFEHSLNIAVNKLRSALGDSAENPRFIETVPRRGYRFLVPVASEEGLEPAAAPSALPTAGAPQPPSNLKRETDQPQEKPPLPRPGSSWLRRALLWGLMVAGVAVLAWMGFHRRTPAPAGKLMLAVLPLENLSPGGAPDYFTSGLHDELLAQLGRMHATRLGIIARTSVLHYQGTGKSIQEIGRELGVHYVMEGTVRRSDDRIRISLQLVQVSDQTQLWSEQFERQAADLLAIQTDVARRVAEALALELLPHQRAEMTQAPTSNMPAYEDYLRGRYHWNQRTEEGLLKAIAYFEDAVRKDPQFALAFAGLADSYNLMGGYGFAPPASVYPKAKAAAEQALQLAPRLAEAHAAMAFAKFYFDWDWPGAEQSFQRALEHNPNNASARQWYGEFLHAMGRLEESEATYRRALEIDPFSLALNDDLGWLLLSQKRNDRAIEQFRKTMSLNPAWSVGRASLAFALARSGQTAAALSELEKLRSTSGATIGYLENAGYAFALSGRKADAEKALGTLRDRVQTLHITPYSVALIHLALGQREKALAELEKGLAQRDAWMVWLAAHPEWEALRNEPRFRQILTRMGLGAV